MGGFARNIPVEKMLAQWQSDAYKLLIQTIPLLLVIIFLSSCNASEQ
jgi:hypothetical protein